MFIVVTAPYNYYNSFYSLNERLFPHSLFSFQLQTLYFGFKHLLFHTLISGQRVSPPGLGGPIDLAALGDCKPNCKQGIRPACL